MKQRYIRWNITKWTHMENIKGPKILQQWLKSQSSQRKKKEDKHIWRYNDQIFINENYKLENSKTILNPNDTIIKKLKPKNILNKRLKKVRNRKYIKQTEKTIKYWWTKTNIISCFSLKHSIEIKNSAMLSLNFVEKKICLLGIL